MTQATQTIMEEIGKFGHFASILLVDVAWVFLEIFGFWENIVPRKKCLEIWTLGIEIS